MSRIVAVQEQAFEHPDSPVIVNAPDYREELEAQITEQQAVEARAWWLAWLANAEREAAVKAALDRQHAVLMQWFRGTGVRIFRVLAETWGWVVILMMLWVSGLKLLRAMELL